MGQEKMELAEQKLEITEKIEDLRDAHDGFSEEADPLLTDSNWTRRVKRRKRVTKDPEEGILDPAELFGTEH